MRANKLFAIINIGGLSLGIVVSGLVYLFFKYENSFDQFHKNKSNIYRLEANQYTTTTTKDPYWRLAELPDPLIERIRSEVPIIIASTRLTRNLRETIVRNGQTIFSEKITYVDPDFFKMFSFSFLDGEPFRGNSSIVISKSMALKFFSGRNPIGEILSLEGDGTKLYTITGVIQDAPLNTSINYDFLAPVESWDRYDQYRTEWGEYAYAFFVQIDPHVNGSKLRDGISRMVNKSMTTEIDQMRKTHQIPSSVEAFFISITALTDIHWNTMIPWEKTRDPSNAILLLAIAFGILLIASINSVSLLLISSSKRKIEIGIRKITGASKTNIVSHFILEAMVYTAISVLLGFLLIFLLLPYFNSIIGESVLLDLDLSDIGFFFALMLFAGFLAGSYPSLLVASFEPVGLLRSRSGHKLQTRFISALVIFQFSMSLFLGTCSYIMFREMEFINNKSLGYDQNQIVVLRTYSSGENSYRTVERFKKEILQEPGVISVSGASSSFFGGVSNMGYTDKEGVKRSVKAYFVDQDFIKTIGLQVLKGRDFGKDSLNDRDAIVINERLADEIAGDPLSSSFSWGGNNTSKIIGVVRNFHFQSFEYPIAPLFLSLDQDKGSMSSIMVRISKDNTESSIKKIEAIWKKVNEEKPFNFRFLNDDIAKQYESYHRWTNIMKIAALFALFIASIGLFGLAGINTLNRYHEIGIRKTFGARSMSVFLLIYKQYLSLILISSIFGAIGSYLIMEWWLENFNYKIEATWEIPLFGILSALLITSLSVSYHAFMGARTNPSETIRYE